MEDLGAAAARLLRRLDERKRQKETAGGYLAQSARLNMMSPIARPPSCGKYGGEERAGTERPATLGSLKLVKGGR